MDLREALTQGFGAEPPHRPVADRLEAGHRAVRRRRIAGSVLAVAVASVVVLGTVTLSGGSRTPNGVATDPSTSTTTAAASPPPELAYYEDDGTLVIDPEALVVTRIENPLHLQPPDQSVALDLRYGGDERWALLKIQFDREGSLGSVGSFDTPSAEFADFADWVAVRATDEPAATRGDDYLPKIPVRFGEGVELVPVDGVRIVLQRPNPDLPANFAPAGSRTAVALVEGPDGRREWVLARDVDGFDVIAFPASRANENVEEFLEFAREQYSGGAGLR